MKKMLIAVCFILLVFDISSGCDVQQQKIIKESSTKSSKEVSSKKVKAIKVKSAELEKAYESNEIAADQKYKDKVVEISGKIQSIDKVLDQTTVTLQGKNEYTLGVICYFDSDKGLTKIKKGDAAKIVGTVSGKGFTAEIKNCTLK